MQFRFAPAGAELLALNLRVVRSADAIRVPAISVMENQRVIVIEQEIEWEKSLPRGDTMMLSNLQCNDFSRFFLSPEGDVA